MPARRSRSSLAPRTVAVVVLDSVGVGELPDADAFGDTGSHTLNHTLEAHPVDLPNLAALGLGSVPSVTQVPTVEDPEGAFGRMREQSPGKDTIAGHWELMGLVTSTPFLVVKRFPDEVMAAFDAATGQPHLGNVVASGTEVIERYGEEHLATGGPIVYTSVDSVFQIAAHVEKVPLETLYAWSAAARELLTGEHLIARVIARPFTGKPGPFERLHEHRKDLAVAPTGPTVMDAVAGAGQEVIAIGKISDIFSGQGVSRKVPTKDDMDGVDKTIAALRERPHGLVFTNLVGFDAIYGHRRDPVGYSEALAAFDARLPELRAALGDDAILMLVSDHGNDPTYVGTDHTREHALLLVTGDRVVPRPIPTRESFADLGATVAELLDVPWDGAGVSFARKLVTPPR